MSDARDEAPRPRVVMMDADNEAGGSPMSTPQVIATEQTGRVVAAAPALARPVSAAVVDRARRPSRTVRLGLAGLAADHGEDVLAFGVARIGRGVGGAGEA